MRILGVVMPFALRALPILLILAILPGVVCAQGIFQGISGSFDMNYSFFSSKTKEASGVTTKTETSTYNPRFTLYVNTTIFPNLRLDAGGIFEGNLTKGKTGNLQTDLLTMKIRPYINLILENPLYRASVGYYRREEIFDPKRGDRVTLINDDYMATLYWRPEGFPSIDTLLMRTNTFDQERSIQDKTRDYLSLSSRYTYKGLDLFYWGTYSDEKNNLESSENRNLTQDGRISYVNSFFDRRLSINTSYEITRQDIKFSSGGTGGEVEVQVFPLFGLSSIDDTPVDDPLSSNPALIDGNLTSSAGINIGLPPLGGDLRMRNIGLDFFNPTEVNRLLVWVDRELTPEIASSFSWSIYYSSDNITWTFYDSLFSAPFGPFQNRFEINFGSVNARYIKVVTRPLSGAVPGASAFPDIFITELQAFTTKPVEKKGTQKISRTTHLYTLDTKTRILNIPTLYHELNYTYYRQDPGANMRYLLSNALSVDHRFSTIFSGRARAGYEFGEEGKERGSAYFYDASLEATPLRTLKHTVVFNGRFEEIGGKSNNHNAIFLYNYAELYRGIDVNLNGGLNFIKTETGQNVRESIINFTSNITPHPTMNFNFQYTYRGNNRSGGGSPSSSDYNQTGNITLTYNPFRTLYLVGSFDVEASKGKKVSTTQNYGLNWSPFPDGMLQFRFFYNETLTSAGNGKDRIFTPGVRWYITKRSFLDVSYQKSMSDSDTQKVDSNSFNAYLRIFF